MLKYKTLWVGTKVLNAVVFNQMYWSYLDPCCPHCSLGDMKFLFLFRCLAQNVAWCFPIFARNLFVDDNAWQGLKSKRLVPDQPGAGSGMQGFHNGHDFLRFLLLLSLPCCGYRRNGCCCYKFTCGQCCYPIGVATTIGAVHDCCLSLGLWLVGLRLSRLMWSLWPCVQWGSRWW